MSLFGEVILRAQTWFTAYIICGLQREREDWVVAAQLLSEIKLQAIVHTYMYALEEKYRPLHAEYQINIYSVSIQSFKKCPRSIFDVTAYACHHPHLSITHSASRHVLFYCPKPPVPLFSFFLSCSYCPHDNSSASEANILHWKLPPISWQSKI